MKYSPETLKYYNNLKNIGELIDEDHKIGIGIVGSPLCGDVMKLFLLFDENDVIIEAKYKVFGCVSAISSMEYVCDLLKGKSIKEALSIENKDVADSLDLSFIKRHCSVLAKESIVSAIDNYNSKKNKKESKNMITISPNASQKIKELILENKKEYLGIEITYEHGGGCSGIVYSLQYVKKEDIEGKKRITVDGIDFYYLEENEILIKGVFIDVVENSFGEGFVVLNKNQMTCGNCNCKC
jgi:nitrogen fixation NifU-like protein